MGIPTELVNACERNPFVWHREDPEQIDSAFLELNLRQNGQLYEFTKKYCLQFVSDTLPFQLMDIVEEDGISDNVYYFRDELGINENFLPISIYEAESVYAVDTTDDSVVLFTPDSDGKGWAAEKISDEFYGFMLHHLS